MRFIFPGVKHSVLRQVGEGLLSVRSGAGAPVAKAVYRGGKICQQHDTPLDELRYYYWILLGVVCVFT